MIEEKKYPVYQIATRWVRDETSHTKHRPEDALPPGRIWDYSTRDIMYRTDPSEQELEEEKAKVCAAIAEKYADGHPTDICVEIKLRHRETWCPGWFNHYTFDEGQDDGTVLASFEGFVQRMLRINTEHMLRTGEQHGPYPLMGAEERWRWRAKEGSPPCRCQHCKERGVIYIDH